MIDSRLIQWYLEDFFHGLAYRLWQVNWGINLAHLATTCLFRHILALGDCSAVTTGTIIVGYDDWSLLVILQGKHSPIFNIGHY